jgi:hypothetical protein
LKYVHAWRLIRTFLISPAWLASGENGKWTRAAQFTPTPELLQSPVGALFSGVFDQTLSRRPQTWPGSPPVKALSAAELRARYEWALMVWMRDHLIELPDKAVPEFVEKLKAAGISLMKKYPKDPAAVVEKRNADYNAEMDTAVRLRLKGSI